MAVHQVHETFEPESAAAGLRRECLDGGAILIEHDGSVHVRKTSVETFRLKSGVPDLQCAGDCGSSQCAANGSSDNRSSGHLSGRVEQVQNTEVDGAAEMHIERLSSEIPE